MDPLVRTYWYSNVTEGLPIWHQPWRVALNLSAGLVAGAISWIPFERPFTGRRPASAFDHRLFRLLRRAAVLARCPHHFGRHSIRHSGAPRASSLVLFRAISPIQNSGPPNWSDRCDPCPAGSGSCHVLAGQGTCRTAGMSARPRRKPRLLMCCASRRSPSGRLARFPKGIFCRPSTWGRRYWHKHRIASLPAAITVTSRRCTTISRYSGHRPMLAHQLLKARGIDYLAAMPCGNRTGHLCPQGSWWIMGADGQGQSSGLARAAGMRGEGIKVWRVR